MTKKILFLALSLMMILLCACGSKDQTQTETQTEVEESSQVTVTDIEKLVKPIDGGYQISREFSDEHQAVDLTAPEGTPLVACFDGVIREAGEDETEGLYVTIETADGYRASYSHCATLEVEKGAEVTAGECIATLGNTGNSTGPHLHFELSDPNGNMIAPNIE